MLRINCFLFIISISLFSSAQSIKIAAIDWCPQICVNEPNAGYTVDLINKVFEDSPYKLEIDILPWSRGLKYVLEGSYDALLAPAKKEAPLLKFPKFGVGQQRMCFFTDAKDEWTYTGEASLSNKHIGIASDSSIEELNPYIEKHPRQFQFQPYHERYVVQNAQKVKKGRIDAFLFTKNTTQYTLKKSGLDGLFKNSGCVSQADIYLAFTPITSQEELIAKVIIMFDSRMASLIQSGYVEQLYKQYQINN